MRNTMSLVSVIIPVYNLADYLRRCLMTVLGQTYQNLEIILVDDRSTDGSGAICDEYSQLKIEDRRLKISVIHQENRGLSAARNAGIKAANGEYICFVDSDDYWESNVLGELMAQIERDNLDVLRFKYQNVNEKYEVFQPYKRDQRLENDYSEIPTDGISFLNFRMNTQCYAVMFIVNRDLFDGCTFTEGIYFEDTDWTPRMLSRAKRVASSNTIVYNYLQREGSITNAVNRGKQKKVLDDKMRLIETMQKQSKELQENGEDNRWFERMIAATVTSIISILSTQFYEERKEYLDILRRYGVYPIKSTSTKTILINLSPRIAVELLHLKNS